MKREKLLHVHNDLELLYTLKDRFGVEFMPSKFVECYIMQGNKIVFIGTCEKGEIFIKNNMGKILTAL